MKNNTNKEYAINAVIEDLRTALRAADDAISKLSLYNDFFAPSAAGEMKMQLEAIVAGMGTVRHSLVQEKIPACAGSQTQDKDSTVNMKQSPDVRMAKWDHASLDENATRRMAQRLKALEQKCQKEECTLTLHLRDHIKQQYDYRTVVERTASHLATFDVQQAKNLHNSRVETDGVTGGDLGRILVVRFENATKCKQAKQSMDAHVRKMFADYTEQCKAKGIQSGGVVDNPDRNLYECVQAFIIGCPEEIRKLKRELRAKAQILSEKTGHKMPNYIGTPILDGCDRKFTPYANKIKELLRETAVLELEGPELVTGHDVIFCDKTKANGESGVSWLTMDEAEAMVARLNLPRKRYA